MVELLQCRDVDRGGNHIITRLPQIHMIVWMNEIAASRSAKEFGGPIRDHLIGIHVGGGSGAGLKDVDRKVVVEPAVNDFLSRRDNGLCQFGIEKAEVLVDL